MATTNDEYELTPETTKRSSAPTQPAPTPTLAYRAKRDDRPAGAAIEDVKDIWMPLWLLVGGVVVPTLAGLVHYIPLNDALGRVAVQLIISSPTMVLAMYIAAKLRGLTLGPVPKVAFKMAAIAVAPTAVLLLALPLLQYVPLGGLVGLIGEFIFYFALIGALFDLDESDTWYCVFVIFLTDLVIYFSLHFTHVI